MTPKSKELESAEIDKMFGDLKKFTEKHGLSLSTNLMETIRRKKEGETGCSLVTKERREQLTKHVRTIESDVKYNFKEQLRLGAHKLTSQGVLQSRPPRGWDIDQWDHMTDKPYIDRLVYAGAFCMAEIDRVLAVERGTFNGGETDPG